MPSTWRVIKATGPYEIGDIIADMHYGIDHVREWYEVVAFINWHEPGSEDALFHESPTAREHAVARGMMPRSERWKYDRPVHWFNDYLQSVLYRAGRQQAYSNKLLIVIEAPEWGNDYTITCAYTYDGRRCGIVQLRQKRKDTAQ